MNIGFIGLGTMGYHLAGYLSKSTHNITVYNRNENKAQKWVSEYTGSKALTISDLAKECEVIFTCVGNDDDLNEVILEVLKTARPNTIIVDHTTTSFQMAKHANNLCNKNNCSFIDAPISGGEQGAINGNVTIMAGGKDKIFTQIKPLLSFYSNSIVLMGDNGYGQLTKMVNQICIAGILQGLSEGLSLAKKANLDIDKLVNTLKNGAAGSWQLENRAKTMSKNQFDFGFKIDWMRKDLGFCLDYAKQNNLELPLTKQVDEHYELLQNQGFNLMDTSVLIKQFDN